MKYRTLIESMGVYLPPKTVSTKEIMRACRKKILPPIERLTGIRFRRMAGDVEFSIDLAKRAVADCLARSRYDADEIDLIVCCNISRIDGPNFELTFEPSTSVRLKKHFGLKNALAFDISNACAGMFTGINVVDGFIKAGFVQRAIVVSGEYITHLTLTAQKEIDGRNDSRFACLTLGDSGAAVLLERTTNPNIGFHAVDMYTLGKFSEYCIARPSREQHGFIMITESVKLHAVAIRESVKHFTHVLAGLRWPREAFNYIIMHQTARTAINQTAKLINAVFGTEICTSQTMINNLAERGNTSTTTHIVALWDNIMNNRIQNGENVAFAIQASGITIGTAAYTFDDLPTRLRRGEKNAVVATKSVKEYSVAVPLSGPIPRIRIESVGTLPLAHEVNRDAVEMVRVAAEDCFGNSTHKRQDIDLLIHSGVHRNDFIVEPALAALIAGKLEVNDDVTPDGQKTFAFDVFNGAVGFLNACYNAIAMIRAGKFNNVMVVASEVENNVGGDSLPLLGVQETGSAVILEESKEGSGFGSFIFRTFTQYIDAFSSYAGEGKSGSYFLQFIRNPDIEKYYLDCIGEAVRDLMTQEGLELSQVTRIFPPQISPHFIHNLSTHLGLLKDKFVDVAENGKDLFTSSLPYTLKRAHDDKLVKAGDIGLIINVGSGIQVGCAIYYF